MRLLIVSSEPLNPADTLGSTFELSQAKLLSKICDVAILSVGEMPSFGTRAKALLRLLLRVTNLTGLLQFLKLSRDACKWSPVRRHRIEDVSIFEGLMLPCGGSFEVCLGRWVAAAEMAFKTYCNAERKPDIIHAHGRFLNAGVFALAARNSAGVPYVYTDHSSYYQRGFAPSAAKPILRNVIDAAAVHSAVSPALIRAIETFLGDKVRPAQIMPNVLDPLFEREPMQPPTPKVPFVFINVASLDANKGVDLLIHAFSRAFGCNANFKLDICGDGGMRSDLEALARDLGVGSQVRFFGKVSKSEVLRRVDEAHVLVVASYVETFGVAAIEAMARGRPVIATRCGGPEFIVNKTNGLLVPAGDVEALTKAMTTITETFSEYDGQTIRASAVATFGETAFLDRMRHVYRAAAT